MGVGRIVSRGSESGKSCFFPLKTKKTTLFAEDLKIQEGLAPPFDAHVINSHKLKHGVTSNSLLNIDIYIYLSQGVLYSIINFYLCTQ